ncbi:hypothetical protein GQ457_10G005210 [Hibiscus cannabinus]
MVYEGTIPSIAHTLSFVMPFLREDDMRLSQICRWLPKIQGQWLALAPNVIKLNFDVAFECQSMRSVYGVTCCDSDGFIMVACSTLHPHVSDAFQVEALACLLAVNFVRGLGFNRVVIEGDFLRFFVSVSYGFVHRKANGAAHVLAQEGKMYSSSKYWMEEAPPNTMLVEDKDRERL